MYAAYTLFDDLTHQPDERRLRPPPPRRSGFADELKAARQEVQLPSRPHAAPALPCASRHRFTHLLDMH